MEKQAEEHRHSVESKQSEETKQSEELRLYGEIASEVAVMLTDSLEEWTAFLTAAGRLYKWPYEDQLLIYAQRPDATACADYAVWNRLNRYIRRGSDAIVLIDNSGTVPALRYVFDFSDTKSGASGRTPWFWEYRDNQHYSVVSSALDRQFEKSKETDMAARLDELSEHLSQEYWNDHKEEILESVDGSFLEDFDPLNVEMAFCHAASVSIAWTLMSRCNLEPEEYFQRQDFENVFEFNTPAAIAALGCAVSESTEKVLREIETAVKGCEREKRKERNVQNGPAIGVQTGGRLPYPGRGAGGHPGQAAGQVRPDAQRVPAPAPARLVGAAVYQREIVPPLPGNRGRGQPPYGSDTARPGAVGWRDGGTECPRPSPMGRADEYLPGPGGGNRFAGTGVLLRRPGFVQGQLQLFPTEGEQVQSIERNTQQTAFSSAVTQREIDLLLCLGTSTDDTRRRVATAYMKQQPTSQIIAVLWETYRGGFGLRTEDGEVSMWAEEDGLRMARGRTARDSRTAQTLSWDDAVKRIGELLNEGRFATREELAAAQSSDYEDTARSLWELYKSLPHVPAASGLQFLQQYQGTRYGDTIANLTSALKNPDTGFRIADAYRHFLDAWQRDAAAPPLDESLRPVELLRELAGIHVPRRAYQSNLVEPPRAAVFITDDEIHDALLQVAPRRKAAVFNFWQGNHTAKQKADFLSREYGTGGHGFAFSDRPDCFMQSWPKGIVLRKPNCEDVSLSWAKAAQIIDRLVAQGRYRTPKEKADYESQHKPWTQRPKNKTKPANKTGQETEQKPPQTAEPENEPKPETSQTTPPAPPQTTPQTAPQNEIVAALQRWNGDANSKRRVAEFMAVHGRERETAAWLAREYGQENVQEPLRLRISGTETETVLTWPQVQRRIAILIRENRFLFPEEMGDKPPAIPEKKPEERLPETKPAKPKMPEPEAERPVQKTEKPAPIPPAGNFHITDEHLGEGKPKDRFRANMDAIQTLKTIENEGRSATREEQEILSRYVGWGGLADVFDPGKKAWKKEYLELIDTLTPEEYEAARASTVDAFFTSPAVCRAMWEAIGNMGFTVGNVLEPSCGVGNFFGTMPESMAKSRLYGVELDGISGRIAKQLYPDASITAAGFETTRRRDFYDLAIGNVPFGQRQVNDREYNHLGFSIHNYFFAKALDQVRPGGVVAFVTSHHTMDSKSTEVRKYLAQRADFLGAVRLPDNAFKANAGTDALTDIIFLQKRDRPMDMDADWVHLARSSNGYPINCFFAKHPEMILGNQSSKSTPYGERVFTVKPFKDRDIADLLHDAVQNIRGTLKTEELPDVGEPDTDASVLPADPNVKNYSYTLVEGEPYYRQNSVMVRAELSASAKERVRAMVELRDCVNRLIALQMEEQTPDSEIQAEQGKLNQLYDAFSERFGLINDRLNRLAFSNDSSYYLLCSLEVLDEDGKLKGKADFFTKRTIRQRRTVSHVDTAAEALAVSIGERACVDLPFMASLMSDGTPEDRAEKIPQIVQSLRGVIYKAPETGPFDYAQGGEHWAQGWQTADAYLSGNVRQKLRTAKEAAEWFPEFQANVKALEAVQPKDLEASEIEVRLGTTWIDKQYFQQFMWEILDTPRYMRSNIRVEYSPVTSEWAITGKSWTGPNDVAACVTYGTPRANGYKLLEDALNLQDIRIYDYVEEEPGNIKRVLNVKETTLAAQKQNLLREEFKRWIWKDPERREKLVRQYNEEMNATRPREYDGSHLVFSGMNPEIVLREHQKNAIARIIYGGNTLLAHEVGAGKTFEMVAAAMEMKRLGLCNKSLFVVPNHLVEQWASEFLRLYPAANILVTTKKDFEAKNRKKFCARIATGEYDAIIIGQSQFEKIPISRERLEQILFREIEDLARGIQELEHAEGAYFSVKQMEKKKKSLETRLKKLQREDKKDDVITFEQLGVDMLFVDESDFYKNLFVYTKMRNVTGLSTTSAQKSEDMFAKCRYMDEITGSRGVVFASATPVSNSLTELYSLLRYLMYDRLQEMGLGNFDSWASRFGETVTALELAPEGIGFRARTRFSKFFNLPELMNLIKLFADIKTADQLNLPVPQVEYHVCACKPTEIQKEMVQDLSRRAALVHAKAVDPSRDNMLKITSDGRKLGLDQRIIDPSLPDEPGTKVNKCVENVLRIWREGDAEKLTQLIFCDISTPKGRKSAKGAGDSEEIPQFNVYDDIRRKLIAGGMPPEQVAFIHDADTEIKKKELFAKVNSGQVRVLMGSTQMMGAGMNVQARLTATHDADCPWRPRDLTQRKGRIERQGNQNQTVHVYRYVTEGTFDAYLWQTVEAKQRVISQIITSKAPVRSCDDMDEVAFSYREIMSICAGDPRIKEKLSLEVEVSRLRLMESDHQSKQFRLEKQIMTEFPEQIAQEQEAIKKLTADVETLSAHPHPEDAFVGLEVQGTQYDNKDKAGEALMQAITENPVVEPLKIGSYRGFDILTYMDAFTDRPTLLLRGQMSFRLAAGEDGRGNITRLDNELERIPDRLKMSKRVLADLRKQRKAARVEIGKPFPYERELSEKAARLAMLDLQLTLSDKEEDEMKKAASQDQPAPKNRCWSWNPGGDRKKARKRRKVR